jgi:hypothetical protein
MVMKMPSLEKVFKGRHFERDIIVLCSCVLAPQSAADIAEQPCVGYGMTRTLCPHRGPTISLPSNPYWFIRSKQHCVTQLYKKFPGCRNLSPKREVMRFMGRRRITL